MKTKRELDKESLVRDIFYIGQRIYEEKSRYSGFIHALCELLFNELNRCTNRRTLNKIVKQLPFKL